MTVGMTLAVLLMLEVVCPSIIITNVLVLGKINDTSALPAKITFCHQINMNINKINVDVHQINLNIHKINMNVQ